MHQCTICRKEKWPWKDCKPVPTWFSPSVIFYCPHQVEWVIVHLDMLEQGRWPPEGRDTGYYDTGGRKMRRGVAYFEVPVAIAADVTMRLDRCGRDGILTLQVKAEGWSVETLAEIQGKPSYVLEDRVRRVINYCSGWRTRQITFDEFNRRRNIAASYRKGDK